MPICSKLRNFLDENRVRYVIITHSRAYTAQEVAASAHIKGKNLVKCVMVNADGQHFMAVTTANHRVDFEKLKQALNAQEVRLEREEEFRELFDDCEVGAMPPFGNLYGIPVVVDVRVYEDEEIAFNGGNHSSVVRMQFADYEKLVRPQRADFAVPAS